MSVKSVQFSVATHIMAFLGFNDGKEISSSTVAESVNADPTFVRKSLSKLTKAGLVLTTRGKSGASVLARSPRQIMHEACARNHHILLGRQRIVMGKLLRLLVSQAMGICSLLGHSSTFGKREDLV